MTKKQEQVIKNLENAFRKCGKVGINVFGLGGELHYFFTEKYTGLAKTPDDFPDFIAGINDGTDNTGTINTHGNYVESGGL